MAHGEQIGGELYLWRVPPYFVALDFQPPLQGDELRSLLNTHTFATQEDELAEVLPDPDAVHVRFEALPTGCFGGRAQYGLPSSVLTDEQIVMYAEFAAVSFKYRLHPAILELDEPRSA